MEQATGGPDDAVTTDIPARLDRLPWSRFHVLVVTALGITWVLDGLEVTIVGSIAPIWKSEQTLALSDAAIGLLATAYLIGAVLGALVFGWLTDRFGRKRMFNVTLAVYLMGVTASAFSWDFWSLALCRLVTGAGIGGEYSAINSAIDELIPARLRGRIDLYVNGSFWLGAVAGAGASLVLLSGRLVAPDLGWRLGFAIGAALGASILYLRRFVPESPRWSVIHGRSEEAHALMDEIERRVGGTLPPAAGTIVVHPQASFDVTAILASMGGANAGRSCLGLVLMVAQAFLFNAVFFTYGLVLTNFYQVPPGGSGLYIFPLAAMNFLGPLVLGALFDVVGRKAMIAGTYGLTGLLMAATAIAFAAGWLDAWTQTFCWMAIFFVASAAASSAYLTVSEIFPLETRALAIALFYALGTLIGGVAAPALFGWLIGTGDAVMLAYGYGAAAVLMILGALAELRLGIDAEGKSLEEISRPLSAA